MLAAGMKLFRGSVRLVSERLGEENLVGARLVHDVPVAVLLEGLNLGSWLRGV